MATPIRPIGIIPMLGFLTQEVALMRLSNIVKKTKELLQVIRTLFRVPLTKPVRITASTAPVPIDHQRSITGCAKKLLNRIAKNSLSSTATQKIGKENKKNERKVKE
jgi:hypothetical protein